MNPTNLETALGYFRAIERGDLVAALDVYAPNAVQTEWPNLLKPKGDRRDPSQLARDFNRGKTLLASQSYEILNHAVKGECVMVEVLWRGTLAIDLGPLKAGSVMQANSAIAFEFHAGKIVAQRNYDCFAAFN